MAFNRNKYALILFSLMLCISACQTKNKATPVSLSLDSAIAEYENEDKAQTSQSLQTIPDEVSQALLPTIDDSTNTLFGEEKYDINAQKLDASTFFSSIVKGTPYSVAIHPDVAGEISLNLKQVALADVFDLVAEIYGYEIKRKQNIYRIYPAGMRTETFAVNYLLMTRDGYTQSSISSGGVSQESGNNNNSSSQNGFSGNSNSSGGNNSSGSSNSINGTNITTRTETDFWTELLATLQSMIGEADGKSVMVTPQAGLVTVRAMPSEIRAVKTFLDISEEIIQRQVILEARIIEVDRKSVV